MEKAAERTVPTWQAFETLRQDRRSSQRGLISHISHFSRESTTTEGEHLMPTITTKDGTQIYYKDLGHRTARRLQSWLASQARMHGKTRCCFWVLGDTVRSPIDRRGHGRSERLHQRSKVSA